MNTSFDLIKAVCAAHRHLQSDGHFDLQPLLAEPALGRVALVSSFGAESAVLLHLVLTARADLEVLFIDTGKHFTETLAYRDRLAATLPIANLRVVRPNGTTVASVDPTGRLWAENPDLCCTARKVFPLQEALDGIDCWISGRKRFQGGLRSQLQAIETDGKRVKLNPLATWLPEQLADYAERHDLPVHPLVDKGYGSIGCAPCTRRLQPGQQGREGRWAGSSKTECGIHLPAIGNAA